MASLYASVRRDVGLALVPIVLTACAGADAPGPTTYVLEAPVDHLDTYASEPMLIEHPDGTLFVSGWGPSEVKPLLWKSADGTSWQRVDVGTTTSDDYGGADVDLAVGLDGTLYFAVLNYDSEARLGVSIAVGVSHDVGASWSWTYLSRQGGEDRPWVKVSPNGTAHVIWSDRDGVHHATSVDQGRTWAEGEPVHTDGGSSHFAVSPSGELAARIKPWSLGDYDEGVDLVAVSVDGGETWRRHPLPGRRVWNSQNARTDDGVWRWVEPVSWDASGDLYYLWSEGQDLWLARSSDLGSSWTSWAVTSREDRTIYYPFLAAGGAGELAATWFERSRGDTGLPLSEGELLEAHVARIDVPMGEEGQPIVLWSDLFVPDSWWFAGDRRDTAGEYFPVVFLSDGDLAVVTPIRNFDTSRHGFSWRRVAAR